MNKSMVEFLEVQLQVGREKLESVQVEFKQINIATLKVEEKVATKAANKMRLLKYNNSLGEGTLKAIRTTEQVHSAFQSKEPAILGLEPCVVCGNWYLYMDVETTSCGHLYHPNCLCMHLQESTSCKNVGNSCTPFGLIAKALSAWKRRSTRSKRWHWEWMLR